MNPPLKSNFVLVQLHETYIEFALNQVVKTSTAKENESNIIVQDEIVRIENIIDTLYKQFWRHTKLNNVIYLCTLHKNKEDIHCDLYSLPNYTNVLKKIKRYLTEIVSIKILIFKY